MESVARGGFPAGATVVKNGESAGEGFSVGSKLNGPGGHYVPSTINAELTRPIELVSFAKLESESLTIVREWKNHYEVT